MSDLLRDLVRRALGAAPPLRPRLPSRFEDESSAGPGWGPGRTDEHRPGAGDGPDATSMDSDPRDPGSLPGRHAGPSRSGPLPAPASRTEGSASSRPDAPRDAVYSRAGGVGDRAATAPGRLDGEPGADPGIGGLPAGEARPRKAGEPVQPRGATPGARKLAPSRSGPDNGTASAEAPARAEARASGDKASLGAPADSPAPPAAPDSRSAGPGVPIRPRVTLRRPSSREEGAPGAERDPASADRALAGGFGAPGTSEGGAADGLAGGAPRTVVQVRIGRVDVRGVRGPSPSARLTARAAAPALTLDAYLRSREEGHP